MAEELQGLLDKINKEGLDKAEQEKARIIAEAKDEAKSIVAKAKEDAEALIAEAKKEEEKLKASGAAGLQQASRDVIIALEESIKEILSNIVKTSVAESMSPEQLADIVSTLAAAYAKGAEPKLTAMASPEQLEVLTQTFTAKLQETFKGGIELKPVLGIDAGIKVSFSGDSVVHDFTSDAIGDMLCAYLNPRILKLVTETK